MRSNGDARADRLLQRVERLRRSRPLLAWKAVRLGFAGAVRGSSEAKRGELWPLRGHVLRSLRRTHDAAGAYRRADHWFRRAGDPRERGRCAIGLVDALHSGSPIDDTLVRRQPSRSRVGARAR